MMKRTSLFLLGVAAGALVAVVAIQPRMLINATANAASSDVYRQLNLFGDVFEHVRAQYVEKPDEAKMIEAAVNGMLQSLDPHSAFLDIKNFRDMQTQTRGEFGGLGIEVTMENGLVKVVSPMDGTPAHRAGIQPNDLITHLDDEPVKGLTLEQAVDKMRGPVNSSIRLRIDRKGIEKPVEVTIVREIISIRNVRTRVEGDDIAYVRITSFQGERTIEQLRTGIADLNKQIPADKLKGYVVDLRNNGGGLLDQAISVTDAFLERGEIVSTRGRNPDDTQRFNARTGDLTSGKPLIVLINGGSASASEIVAGALQDHKRATLLGSRSFGKGSVQTVIPVSSFGALKLTTARYYTPSGRSIQAKGIAPDIELIQDLPEELKGKIETRGESSLRGHLSAGDKEEEKGGSPAYVPPDAKDDKQLHLALDLLRGTQKHSAFPPNPKVPVPN
ncbi:MAG: S41 family peptidase [Bradyrhizobiaceae bacterium]|nr:S41 family peptidase [Bradyrhizobiaceae bacterium]